MKRMAAVRVVALGLIAALWCGDAGLALAAEEYDLLLKNGRIVDERDDLMSATRYGHMMLRLARTRLVHTIRQQTNIGMIY